MEIPAAGFIESARDELAKLDHETCTKLVHELQCASWDEGQDVNFVNGYLLGLMTALILQETKPTSC